MSAQPTVRRLISECSRVLVVVLVSAYRAPALAGDAQDHDGHPQPDEGIEDRCTRGDGEVRASPPLWIRSASSARLPLSANTTACTAAVTPRWRRAWSFRLGESAR